MSAAPFESVLVANRGEIAVRVTRTCRRLAVRTIAVYSDADGRALHVSETDEAVRIGPPPAIDSYLNQDAILDAANRSQAQAIHPGYGFLAENADFAERCVSARLAWIGPPPAAMRALGDKAGAKALAERHGVPLVRGYHGADQAGSVLRTQAQQIGFPVLIKASAGGGGRGMRVVHTADEFGPALEAAKREALSSFGDDRVLLEQYLPKPRHVEVQILADQHGRVVHLGERECSIQRRHQKLVEESPSPAVDATLRAQMGEAAIKLARAAGYTNAGTVEFLLDDKGQFAFLEVNARLQVEHPVTEAVTGLDLVEQQLRIAAGEPLAFTQDEVELAGHAIEVRVIAENPLAGFLPSSGTIAEFHVPSFVRVDSGVAEGSTVSPHYDSLLAKLISHEATRTDALRAMAQALQETVVEGVRTNVDLLLSTIEHPAFVDGHLHTGFLAEHAIVEEVASVPAEVLAAACALDFLYPHQQDDPWRGPAAWRLGRIAQPAAWVRAGRAHSALVSDGGAARVLEVVVGERMLAVQPLRGDYPAAMRRLRVDGRSVTIWEQDEWCAVEWQGRSYRLQRPPPLSIEDTARDRGASGHTGRLSAPMPGRIVKIAVSPGQQVRPHDPLVVLEAMKMEHVVEAPHAGVVQEVCVEVGQQVAAGELLLALGDEKVE